VPNPKPGIATICLIACLLLLACTATVQEPTAIPTPAPVTVPVTVEVTRIVPQQVIVETTPTPPQACVPAAFDEAREIKIGAILPLSSPGALLKGFAMQTALNIAVAELNESGGIRGLPVRLITYDSAGQPDQAAAYARRLVMEDCVAAITGLYHNQAAFAVAEKAAALDMPLIIAGATADNVTAAKFPQVFRIAPTDTLLANMPAKWLAEVGDYNQDGMLFVVPIIDSRTADSAHWQRMQAGLDEFAIRYEVLPVDLPSSDFSSVIARIVTMDHLPDALFIYAGGEDALEMHEQILASGIGPQKNTLIINHDPALDDDLFWRIVPDGAGAVVGRIGPWAKTVTAQGQTFAIKYAQYMERWPEAHAFAAYDSIYLIADALERSPTPRGPDVIAALRLANVTLASGRYYFPYTADNSSDGLAAPDFMWQQWPDVHTLYLQYAEPGQPSSEMPVIWPQIYRTVDAPVIR
jgi:ABC-type branched-subunit amino acid transport system substrate-binding protein